LLTVHDESLIVWAVTLDAERIGEITIASDWAEYARDAVARGFTTAECSIYDIDPCPSLEDIKSRR